MDEADVINGGNTITTPFWWDTNGGTFSAAHRLILSPNYGTIYEQATATTGVSAVGTKLKVSLSTRLIRMTLIKY